MKPALKATLALPCILVLVATFLYPFLYLFVCYPMILAIITFLALIWIIWDTLYRLFRDY